MNSDIVVAVLKNDTMPLANQEVTIKQTKSSYSSAQPVRSAPHHERGRNVEIRAL